MLQRHVRHLQAVQPIGQGQSPAARFRAGRRRGNHGLQTAEHFQKRRLDPLAVVLRIAAEQDECGGRRRPRFGHAQSFVDRRIGFERRSIRCFSPPNA